MLVGETPQLLLVANSCDAPEFFLQLPRRGFPAACYAWRKLDTLCFLLVELKSNVMKSTVVLSSLRMLVETSVSECGHRTERVRSAGTHANWRGFAVFIVVCFVCDARCGALPSIIVRGEREFGFCLLARLLHSDMQYTDCWAVLLLLPVYSCLLIKQVWKIIIERDMWLYNGVCGQPIIGFGGLLPNGFRLILKETIYFILHRNALPIDWKNWMREWLCTLCYQCYLVKMWNNNCCNLMCIVNW